jgi:glucose/arabinose dehydrogenase
VPQAQCSTPTEIAWTPDGRILITEKEGRLFVYDNQQLTLALDLSSVICLEGERGLEGVVVHPNFASNHYIYLYYTYQKFGTCNIQSPDDPVDQLSRFVLADNNTINPASEEVLLDTPPTVWRFHNGGDMKFGHDGYLYVTVGEGGSNAYATSMFGEHAAAEDPGMLWGKILRLTDTGGIPPGNPFTGADSARCNIDGAVPSSSSATKCQEVYAMGFRNPFRFSLDPNSPTTRFLVNDVGEDTWEEVDLLQPGADYGWPTREGPCAYTTPAPAVTDCGPAPAGLTNPIYWYMHDNTTVIWQGTVRHCAAAITGSAFVPAGLLGSPLDGTYLFADYDCGGIWSMYPNSTAPSGYSATLVAQVTPAGFCSCGLVSMRFAPYADTIGLYYLKNPNYGKLPGELHVITFAGSFHNEGLTQSFMADWADYFNTGTVNLSDLVETAKCFGVTSDSSIWSRCSYFDLAERGTVDIRDLVMVASNFGLTTAVGKGLPPGTMDPSWKTTCTFLPYPEQSYCSTLA